MTLESITSRVIDALPTPVANNFKSFSSWCGRNIENLPADKQQALRSCRPYCCFLHFLQNSRMYL